MIERYERLVPRGEKIEGRPEPVVDNETVRVVCMPSRKEVTFELWFPTQESHDAFLASDRTKKSALRAGGRMTILTPHHLIAPETKAALERQPGTIERLGSRATNALGIPDGELRSAQNAAWDALLAAYKK